MFFINTIVNLLPFKRFKFLREEMYRTFREIKIEKTSILT